MVLTTAGHVAEQGTYEQLKSQGGYVSSILLQPTITDYREDSPEYDSNVLDKIVRGPTNEELQDLTRKIGDMSVYLYYLKSVGLGSLLLFIANTVVFVFCVQFPCESRRPSIIQSTDTDIRYMAAILDQ